MNEFEKGAVFALELLRKHIQDRTDKLNDARRTLNLDRDVGTVLGSVEHVLTGLMIHYDTDLMRQLNEQRKPK